MGCWDERYLRETGCIYRARSIMCDDRTKCDKCGWNPKVEKERKKKMGWGVYDYPEMTAKEERKYFGDETEEEYTDEWEDFYLDDTDIDEPYEADGDDIL